MPVRRNSLALHSFRMGKKKKHLLLLLFDLIHFSSQDHGRILFWHHRKKIDPKENDQNKKESCQKQSCQKELSLHHKKDKQK